MTGGPLRAILRAPMKGLFATAAFAMLLAGAACTNPCQELADRICGCQPDTNSQAACTQHVKDQMSAQVDKPTTGDNAYCEQLLGTCHDPATDRGMCDRLNTYQGKVDCGLAYPKPQ